MPDNVSRVSAAVCRVCRKGWKLHQLGALAAMEKRRAADAGGRAARSGHPRADLLRVRDLYQKEGGKFPDPILNLRWPYTKPANPSLSEVAREINGQALADVTDPATGQVIKAGQQLPSFAFLRDDGSTLSGNWIYCGSWTEAGNQMARRGTEDPSGLGIFPNWAWSWPANRRVLYNRASCDPAGKPWDPTRRQVWWNESAGRWVGNDVPDFKPDSKPADHMGPFIMNPEGIGRLFAPLTAVQDGPFPEHYEPSRARLRTRCILSSRTIPSQQANTSGEKYGTPGGRLHRDLHDVSPDGALSLLDQEQPDERAARARTVRRDPLDLANDLTIKGGDKVKVSSARGSYVAKAMVTHRIKPMMIDGKKTYQIGIPIHWGYRGIAEDSGLTALNPVNMLTPAVVDPNAYTPEFKGFLVKVEKV